MDLPTVPGGFQVVLADPPWDFTTWSDKAQRSAKQHYATMRVADIAALPVASIAAPDAVLLLWATFPNLPDAFRVIDAWGFTYKTCAFTWVKTAADGSAAFGLGYYTRSNAEPCLLATRGMILPRFAHDVGQVLFSGRRRHSHKPDGQYDAVRRLFGPDVRRLELFARRAWPGWTAWGLEAPADPALMLDVEAAG